MMTKTPRTDELLELMDKNSFGWKTKFDLAIELAEKLEFELSNRQSDIVKPITKSPEAMTDDELKELIKTQATFKRHEIDYYDLVGFSMQLVTSDNKWRTATDRISVARAKHIGEKNIRADMEKWLFHAIRAGQSTDNQNADIVKPITISHVTDKFPIATKIKEFITGQVCMGTYGLVELEVVELEKANRKLLEALLKIANRLEAGQTDEWTIAALARIAREAINKSTEEI